MLVMMSEPQVFQEIQEEWQICVGDVVLANRDPNLAEEIAVQKVVARRSS